MALICACSARALTGPRVAQNHAEDITFTNRPAASPLTWGRVGRASRQADLLLRHGALLPAVSEGRLLQVGTVVPGSHGAVGELGAALYDEDPVAITPNADGGVGVGRAHHGACIMTLSVRVSRSAYASM